MLHGSLDILANPFFRLELHGFVIRVRSGCVLNKGLEEVGEVDGDVSRFLLRGLLPALVALFHNYSESLYPVKETGKGSDKE